MRRTKTAILYILFFILIAHVFTPLEYDWTKNTISDLAAQGSPNGWIMRLGFIGFGLIYLTGLLKNLRAGDPVKIRDVFLYLYSFSILITGFFSASPYLPDIGTNVSQASIHSSFATLAGIFLTIAILISIFRAQDPKQKQFHLIFLILITLLSAGFGLAENGQMLIGKGLMQRLLWLVSFAWFWKSYKPFLSSP